MRQKKLKLLRTKIPVSLKEAIDLLNNNHGNLEDSEREFHENRIDEICRISKCEKQKARKFYIQFHFNQEKAINAINNEQKILRIEASRIIKNTIGFILWFEYPNGEPYRTKKRNDIFIPAEDFDFIKETFESNCSENFDSTDNNYFDKTECKSIIGSIEKLKTVNENQAQFIRSLTKWMKDNLQVVETLVVYGNL